MLTQANLTRFVDWLNEKKVSNNTAYKQIRAIRYVANYATQYVHVHQDLFRYEFPYSTRNGSVARLAYSEVEKIIRTEAQGIELIARDVFTIACFTGLRISDILTLHEAVLSEFHFDKFQEKTGETVSVTLHVHNEDLVRKYHANPITQSRQNLSAALKEVLKRADLTAETIKRIDRGSETLKVTAPKYKLISFHSGRRFYARLLNDLGLGMEIARDELGHTASNITEHYAGSPDHKLRIIRVREAMKNMDKKMQEIALMKVA